MKHAYCNSIDTLFNSLAENIRHMHLDTMLVEEDTHLNKTISTMNIDGSVSYTHLATPPSTPKRNESFATNSKKDTEILQSKKLIQPINKSTKKKIENKFGLEVNDIIKVLYESESTFWEARIIKVTPQKIRVTYPGWDESWDEWIKLDSTRIDPLCIQKHKESNKIISKKRPRELNEFKHKSIVEKKQFSNVEKSILFGPKCDSNLINMNIGDQIEVNIDNKTKIGTILESKFVQRGNKWKYLVCMDSLDEFINSFIDNKVSLNTSIIFNSLYQAWVIVGISNIKFLNKADENTQLKLTEFLGITNLDSGKEVSLRLPDNCMKDEYIGSPTILDYNKKCSSCSKDILKYCFSCSDCKNRIDINGRNTSYLSIEKSNIRKNKKSKNKLIEPEKVENEFDLCMQCFCSIPSNLWYHYHPKLAFKFQKVISKSFLEQQKDRDYIYSIYNNEKESNGLICSLCKETTIHESNPLLSFGANNKNLVHKDCARTCPEVIYYDNKWWNVSKAIKRGNLIKCKKCNLKGATIGCFDFQCKNSYHLKCLKRYNANDFYSGLIFRCIQHELLLMKEQKFDEIIWCDKCNKRIEDDENFLYCTKCEKIYYDGYDICIKCFKSTGGMFEEDIGRLNIHNKSDKDFVNDWDHIHSILDLCETNLLQRKHEWNERESLLSQMIDRITNSNIKKSHKAEKDCNNEEEVMNDKEILLDNKPSIYCFLGGDECIYCHKSDSNTYIYGPLKSPICIDCCEKSLLNSEYGNLKLLGLNIYNRRKLVNGNSSIKTDELEIISNNNNNIDLTHKSTSLYGPYINSNILVDTARWENLSKCNLLNRTCLPSWLSSFSLHPPPTINHLWSCIITCSFFDLPGRSPKWATHASTDYHGIWLPQAVRWALERYTDMGDKVLSNFLGRGTDAIESFLMSRQCIGIDINPEAIKLAKKNTTFVVPSSWNLSTKYKPLILRGDSRKLPSTAPFEDESYDMILSHPPYKDCVKYTDDNKHDISSSKELNQFQLWMRKVAQQSWRMLKPGKALMLGIGDTRHNNMFQPVSFRTIQTYLSCGFVIEEMILKRQRFCKQSALGMYLAEKYDFLLFSHEMLIIFRKPSVKERLKNETKLMELVEANKSYECKDIKWNIIIRETPFVENRNTIALSSCWTFDRLDSHSLSELVKSRVLARYGSNNTNWIEVDIDEIKDSMMNYQINCKSMYCQNHPNALIPKNLSKRRGGLSYFNFEESMKPNISKSMIDDESNLIENQMELIESNAPSEVMTRFIEPLEIEAVAELNLEKEMENNDKNMNLNLDDGSELDSNDQEEELEILNEELKSSNKKSSREKSNTIFQSPIVTSSNENERKFQLENSKLIDFERQVTKITSIDNFLNLYLVGNSDDAIKSHLTEKWLFVRRRRIPFPKSNIPEPFNEENHPKNHSCIGLVFIPHVELPPTSTLELGPWLSEYVSTIQDILVKCNQKLCRGGNVVLGFKDIRRPDGTIIDLGRIFIDAIEQCMDHTITKATVTTSYIVRTFRKIKNASKLIHDTTGDKYGGTLAIKELITCTETGHECTKIEFYDEFKDNYQGNIMSNEDLYKGYCSGVRRKWNNMRESFKNEREDISKKKFLPIVHAYYIVLAKL